MRRKDGWYWVKFCKIANLPQLWEVAEYSASTNMWYRTTTMVTCSDDSAEYVGERLKEPE